MDKRLGLYAGFIGDPLPAQFGGNVAVNAADYMRVTAGYGTYNGLTNSLSCWALGTRAFVPDWDFSPTAGLGVGGVILNAAALPTGTAVVQGVNQSSTFVFLTLGLDWQTSFGLYLGAGVNVSMGQAGSLPFVDVGWFF